MRMRGLLGAMGALAAIVAAIHAAPAASAQTGAPSGTQAAAALASERQALVRARAQAREAKARSEAFERSAAASEAEADRARNRAAAVAARIQQAEADLRGAQARVAILAAMQRAQARRLAAQQEPIARLTAGLQLMAHRPPILALIQPGSITDAVHLRMMLAKVMPVIARRTAGLRAALAQSRALQADAEQARTSLARSYGELTRRRAELARLETQKRIASRQYRDNAAEQTERALAMSEDARDIVDLMQRMEGADAVRAALIRLPGPILRPARPGEVSQLPAAQAAQAAQASSTPTYRLPAVGDIVTGFGELSNSGVRSRGLTIATQPGATVVAPAGGLVAFAGPFRDYGQIVIIDHGTGWTSLITHMRRLSVAVGETVRQGDPIGVTASVRPQVTIELRREDRPVDIAAMMR
jgi:septal ring factor EnvC (AmiA/AmiB activator)